MYALSPRIDRLLLGVVADVRTVGVYSAAASLIMILKLIHSSITMTFSPIVADAYNRVSVNRAKRLYVMVTRWDARLTFLVVLVSVMLANELLWLFGNQYSEALAPFLILSISVFITTIPGPTGAFLQMTNRQRIDALNALLFFIISPLLQILFVQLLGWIGVAFGVLAAAIIINAIQVGEIKYYYQFHPFRKDHLIFSIAASVVLVLGAIISLEYALPFRLLSLGAILVGFFVFLYHQRTPNDEMLLKMMLPKKK
jgi:O-antigen/teichoic acid export membrane protein